MTVPTSSPVPGRRIRVATVEDDARLRQSLEILSAIQEVQSGGAPMSSEIARKVLGAFHEAAPPAASEQDLSRREREILELLLRGLSNKEIASDLSISVPTVKVHIRHIYEKLHVRCRVDLFVKFGEVKRPSTNR